MTIASVLDPTSVLLVGASEDERKIGSIALANLRACGYAGRIEVLHPRAERIQGVRAVAEVSRLRAPVDTAIIAVPSDRVLSALDTAADAGARSAVIFSSGFAEVDRAGIERQAALESLSRRRSMTLIGPNCLGVMNVPKRWVATFSVAPQRGLIDAGPISLVSQSGAFGLYGYMLAERRELGLGYWVTTGNEAALDSAHVIDWLADDAVTKVIALYIEGVRDGTRFRLAIERARRLGKRIVVLKSGRRPSGALAARSHTASAAGDGEVFDAICAEAGAIVAPSVDALFRDAEALARCPPGGNRNVAILTVSGGVGALLADHADEFGLQLPELPLEAQQQLKARVPFCAPRNPVDLTGQLASEPDLFELGCTLVASADRYSSVVVFIAGAGLIPQFAETLMAGCKVLGAAGLRQCVVGLATPALQRALRNMGVLFVEDPYEAMRSIRLFGSTDSVADVGATSQESPPTGTRRLNEYDSMTVLRAFGVEVPRMRVVDDEPGALSAARDLGYPVALKVLSAGIAHKTDVGGVELDLGGDDPLACAVRRMRQRLSYAGDTSIEGFLVVEMLRIQGEFFVGCRWDPVFGLVAAIGYGGIDLDARRDVALVSGAASSDRIEDVLRSLNVDQALSRIDSGAGHALRRLVDVIVSIVAAAASYGGSLRTLEVNPLVFDRGRFIAADAVIELLDDRPNTDSQGNQR